MFNSLFDMDRPFWHWVGKIPEIMILSFGTVNIKTEKFESYEALDDALALCEAGSMYAGQKRGNENSWNMIAVTDADTGAQSNLSGKELTEQGLPISIKEKRSSKLYFYKKQNG